MDTRRKQSEANLSADIVGHLRGQGMTLRGIGELVGLSESFISRVGRGERAFTIEHLLRLQDALGKPLPLLLLEATSQGSVPESLSPLYEKAREVLAAGLAMKRPTDKRRRKTG